MVLGRKNAYCISCPFWKRSQPGTPQRELGLGLVQLHVLAKSLLWDLIMGSPGESQFWHFFSNMILCKFVELVNACFILPFPKGIAISSCLWLVPASMVYESFEFEVLSEQNKKTRSKGIDPKGTKMMRRLTVGRAQGEDLMRVPFLKVEFFLVGYCWKTYCWHLLVIFDICTFWKPCFFQFFDMVFWNMCYGCCYVVSFNRGGNGVDQRP